MLFRVRDIFFSLIILSVALLPMVITAMYLFTIFGRKLFYVDYRVGLNEAHFKLYKFRTMKVNPDYTEASFTQQDDIRLIKFGKFLRKHRIDELPQIANILIGNLSLVGPRPEQIVFYEYYKKNIKNYELRQLVKPGLTGYSQIRLGYVSDDIGTKKKLTMDLHYIKRKSFFVDLKVIIQTISVVIKGTGAR